jgi:hypothetical protein
MFGDLLFGDLWVGDLWVGDLWVGNLGSKTCLLSFLLEILSNIICIDFGLI